MSETYIPEGQNNPPSNMNILDIIKVFKSSNNEEYVTRLINVNDLLSGYIEPSFENIQGSPYTNEQLNEILTTLATQTLVNRNEIIYTKHLVALLTLILLEQGIGIPNKELMQNLDKYIKIK